MQNIRETLSYLSSELGESTMIQYYPSLRYLEIDLKSTCVLSFILGWNISGRPCYISKDKVSRAYQMTHGEVDLAIAELLHKGFLKIEEVKFKSTTAKGFIGDIENISKFITNSEEFIRISKIKQLNEELKQLQEGVLPSSTKK